MRMLRCGITEMDRLRNERIRATTRMGEIPKKVQERRFNWYGYVKRNDEEYVGERVMWMGVLGGEGKEDRSGGAWTL